MANVTELKQKVPNTHKDPAFQHLTDVQYRQMLERIDRITALLSKALRNAPQRNN